MERDYPTDTTYVSLVVSHLATAWIDAALRAQHATPPRQPGQTRFSYVDLGCGYGTTLLCLAAAYPDAQFTGVDANPAHIEMAREWATAAGLTNIAFKVARFGDATLHDIAPAQYVVTHGVYTWIAAAAQVALLKDIARLRARGGVVAIGASSMAGNARDLPLRRVVNDHATGAGGDRLERALTSLDAAQMGGALRRGDAEQLIKRTRQHARIAEHDILSAAWSSVWTADLATALAPAGVTYAGIQNPSFWRADFAYSAAQRAALDAAPTLDARLTLQDCFLDYKYANHLFAEPGPSPSRAQEIIALTQPAEAVILATRTPAGRLDFDNDLTRPLVQHLSNGPATIADLTRVVDPSSNAALLRSVDALYASGQIAPVDAAHPANTCAALNAAFEQTGAMASACASPLGTPMRHDLVTG